VTADEQPEPGGRDQLGEAGGDEELRPRDLEAVLDELQIDERAAHAQQSGAGQHAGGRERAPEDHQRNGDERRRGREEREQGGAGEPTLRRVLNDADRRPRDEEQGAHHGKPQRDAELRRCVGPAEAFGLLELAGAGLPPVHPPTRRSGPRSHCRAR
jgi:hypothetical protein